MRRLSKPSFAQAPVYAACVQGVGNMSTQAICNAISMQVGQQELAYDQLASMGLLYQWAHHPRGDDHLAVIGHVTRGDFKGLYTGQMVRRGTAARFFYDKIKTSAPNNICPYCGLGSVESLDHFLPKSHYSSLSVLPLNLIPACNDCNREKLDSVMTSTSLSSHPYFEEERVFQEEWLSARIVQSAKPIAEFQVVAPSTWAPAMTQRVLNHFNNFDLARRYSTQAAERMIVYAAGIHDISNTASAADIDVHLHRIARTELCLGVNSWQAALAKAVADDIWFRTEGYKSLL